MAKNHNFPELLTNKNLFCSQYVAGRVTNYREGSRKAGKLSCLTRQPAGSSQFYVQLFTTNEVNLFLPETTGGKRFCWFKDVGSHRKGGGALLFERNIAVYFLLCAHTMPLFM